jgi:Transposase DDE domain group 1
MPPCVLIGMGLVITPLPIPRRFNPLAQPLGTLQKLGGRDLVWRFDGGDITSDGGALVLKKLEERTGIVRRFAACFTDYRNPKQIEHPLLDLILQRVFGLALGYEDLNDHDELRRDPMLAVALSKDDVKGEQRRRTQDRGKALAGKSTLNRLELTAPDYDGSPRQKESDRPETKKIVVDPESIDALLVDLFLEAHEPAPEKIILDLDATDDVLYGHQEGRFFHGYYRDYCYLPLYVFCGEHLLCARLRRSNIDASADSVEELEPLVARIRQRWPAVKIQLRGDAGFCREKLMAWCEREGMDYIFGLAQNSRLKKLIEAQMAQAEKQYGETQAPARVFSEFFYSTTDTWSCERRVIAKAEHLDKGANPRFVVTSLSQQQMAARELYEKGYCARGECPENRIKEQQLDLFADRTSTGKMWSNQLRLYFSSIAYVLLQTLRRMALAGTELEKAQCGTIRLKLLKIGAQVRVTVRKIWVSLASGYPYAALFTGVLATLEAGSFIK